MKHQYGYLVLVLFLVLLAGILWYSFSREPAALLPTTQSSPSGTVTTTREGVAINLMTLQPPPGWRALKQSSSSVTFTDLPANAIIYNNPITSDRLIVDNDTLGYSTMMIKKITVVELSADDWAGYLAPKTDPMPGQTLETTNNKVVESEITGLPGGATGTLSLVYADTSTIYIFNLEPYEPTSLKRGISLSSTTIQIYKSFIANFVEQLP